jgi:acetolactate synthase-1/2/3 large subunit
MRNPDFVKLAEAHGLTGIRVEKRSQVAEAVADARRSRETVVIDFRVEKEDTVYPMVAPGMGIAVMIRRPYPALAGEDSK